MLTNVKLYGENFVISDFFPNFAVQRKRHEVEYESQSPGDFLYSFKELQVLSTGFLSRGLKPVGVILDSAE